MSTRAADYEKLGEFFLGKEYDLGGKKVEDELLLYDSKDLVTHGVVLGMTGSGKTGLCIALLEEAAMDNIPAIVIDPKGDIANLMLNFPELRGSDFRPWINEDDAAKKGVSPDEHAEKTAAMWKNGLADWGQGPERMRQLQGKVDVNVFTPGSKAGIPVSILSSLEAPPFEVVDDGELLGERIESTVSSLLSLVGVDADPIQSPEAVYLSNIFAHEWQAGRGLTLERLILHIRVPPFDKIGVVSVEDFLHDYMNRDKKRQALEFKFNNLLASPGFATWLEGPPLDVAKMMHGDDGRPRISIFSISHLSDSERMFFVSLLLNQMLGWMRAQSGTSSLRALLYMDEIYGFLPPVSNPPSKKPMMTMLKQARAFGLGCLLATQNPVDLDYKALSNIGTWFLGRLQTERDKLRVLDGLEGAAAEQDSGFDRKEMETLLSGLGSRVFLMNNVHEDGPVVFHVRWVMSYLRGPLTRTQIKKLMDPKREQFAAAERKAAPRAAANPMGMPGVSAPAEPAGGARPAVGRGVVELFAAAAGDPRGQIYEPVLLRAGTVHFSSSKAGVDGSRSIRLLNPLAAAGVDWDHDESLTEPLGSLSKDPARDIGFGELPGYAMNADNYKQVKKDFSEWMYRNQRAEVFHCPALKEYSQLGEAEGEFRGRLALKAREARDEAVEELRGAMAKKLRTLENRLRSAEGTLERQKAEASSAKVQAGISILGSVLGGLLGRKSGSSARSSVSRSASAYKQHKDVSVGKDKVEGIQEDIELIERETAEEIEKIREEYETQALELETVTLKPTRTNVKVDSVALLWRPEEG
jgi:hypothetical protein